MKDFNAEMHRANAIQEVRARGVTVPGVAELIVDHHTPLHVLQNLDQVQALGEALAKDPDSELGAKMRALLAEAAAKEVKAEPTPIVDLVERAVQHVMKAGYSEEAARKIVAEHGADTVLEGENAEDKNPTPATPPSGASAPAAAEAEAPATAAGSSPAPTVDGVEATSPAPEQTTKASEPSPNAAA